MTATTTSRLALRQPDPLDLVNVATDLNASLAVIDAAVGIAVTTALPSNPFSGKAVAISTDSYRSYFSNGTAPASASWVELLNSSGTFGSDIKLAVGKKLILGTDVNLYRDSANVLKTDDSLTVALNLSVAGSGAITGNATVGGTLGVTGNTTLSGTATVTGKLTAGSIATGSTTITPSAIDAPTSLAVTGLSVAGTTFVGVCTANTTAIGITGSAVKAFALSAVSGTGLTVWVVRGNTTGTAIHWAVFGS